MYRFLEATVTATAVERSARDEGCVTDRTAFFLVAVAVGIDRDDGGAGGDGDESRVGLRRGIEADNEDADADNKDDDEDDDEDFSPHRDWRKLSVMGGGTAKVVSVSAAIVVSSTNDKKHPDAKDVLAKSEKEELAVDKVDEELLRAGSSCCFLLGDSGWFFCFGGPCWSFCCCSARAARARIF